MTDVPEFTTTRSGVTTMGPLPGNVGLIFAILVAISGFLVFSTWYFGHFWQTTQQDWSGWPLGYKLLVLGDLTQENVIASWFSSMLLLLVSALFGYCYLIAPRLSLIRGGTGLISILFLFLSIDEQSSIHERVLAAGPSDQAEALLIFVIVGIVTYLLIFTLAQLRHTPLAAVALLVGAACFLSIPVFENYELEVLQRPLGVMERELPLLHALEEGTELAGSLAFLIAGRRLVNRMGSKRAAVDWVRDLPTTRLFSWFIAATVLFGCAGIWISTSLEPEIRAAGTDGIGANWFAAAPLFLAATLIWWKRPMPGHTLGNRTLIALALIASVYTGANLQEYFLPGYNVTLHYLILAALTGLILIIVRSVSHASARTLAAAGGLAALFAVGVGAGPMTAPLGLLSAFFILTYLQFSHSGGAQPPDRDGQTPA